jgi:acyl-[acyl-carrier-protein]-phospholipid O-acyltransferase/long-chain-fatty-acid--[acyl-carrier-protein] ligase
MQIQNAFNDNVAKFTLLPFGAWLVLHGAGFEGIEHVLAALLVLPYILFAPTCGWLADRYAKSSVIRFSAWLQLAVLGLMAFGLWQGHLWVTILAFFLLAVQSSILSPAKMGVVKELLGSKKLALASGVMEGTVILAILAGQILGGIGFDHGLRRTASAGAENGWNAALVVVVLLWAGGLISIALAHGVEQTRAQSAERFRVGLMFRHFKDAAMVWRDAELRTSVLGVAYFWGFAGFVNLVVLQVAKDLHGGGEGTGTAISVMMTWASVGIAAGSVVAGLKSRKGIDWGLVPIGAFIMAAGLFILAAMPSGSVWQYAMLAISGAGGAAFLVPLNAHVQDHPPAEKRGTVLAVVNLFSNIAGIGAVGLQFAAAAYEVPVAWQFVAVGVVTVFIGSYSTWRHGADMVRSLLAPMVRMFYRTKVLGADRMPEKGGVLLMPNHETFFDAFIAGSLSPRPVRFVMDADFERNPAVGWFTRLFDTVPIELGNPRRALRNAAEALKAGDAVVLFPEGQLSRIGMMNEVQRGFELIARMAKCPVVVLYMDGLWGSFFSFSDGGFFKGWPKRPRYPIIGALVGPMESHEADIAAAHSAFRSAAAECLAERVRSEKWKSRKIARFEAAGPDLRRYWANGFQIGFTAMLDRVRTVCAWRDDDEAAPLGGIPAACELFKLRFKWLEPGEMPGPNTAVIGGGKVRGRMKPAPDSVRFYDFGAGAGEVPDGEAAALPCLAVDGIVVAISVPNPPMPDSTSFRQIGVKPGSRGRLLDGFMLRQGDGAPVLDGPSCPPGGLPLPQGASVDDDGFVRFGGE